MVEAIIGALFLDDGMDKARIFVDRFLMPRPSPLPSVTWEDADRRLNEFAMRKRSIIPTYRIQTVEENRRHRCCFIGDTLISQAEGGDAHEAKALAAKDALETERRWSGQVSRAAARSGS
jgi:dsRNA-specific ribonuclease